MAQQIVQSIPGIQVRDAKDTQFFMPMGVQYIKTLGFFDSRLLNGMLSIIENKPTSASGGTLVYTKPARNVGGDYTPGQAYDAVAAETIQINVNKIKAYKVYQETVDLARIGVNQLEQDMSVKEASLAE
jgi:hypothetical protein